MVKQNEGILGRRMHGKGFTLIEVLVTVAIVAILGSVALPEYGAYVRRGNAQEATSALADARVRFEQYFQDNRTYVGMVAANCTPVITNMKYFTYACTSSATTFTVTATGVAAKGMSGYSYTINEANIKTSTADGFTPVSNTCWITKKGETCT